MFLKSLYHITCLTRTAITTTLFLFDNHMPLPDIIQRCLLSVEIYKTFSRIRVMYVIIIVIDIALSICCSPPLTGFQRCVLDSPWVLSTHQCEMAAPHGAAGPSVLLRPCTSASLRGSRGVGAAISPNLRHSADPPPWCPPRGSSWAPRAWAPCPWPSHPLSSHGGSGGGARTSPGRCLASHAPSASTPSPSRPTQLLHHWQSQPFYSHLISQSTHPYPIQMTPLLQWLFV